MKLNKEKIVRYLKEHVAENISSYQLIKKAGAYDGDLSRLTVIQLFELNDEVHDIARQNGFILEMDHHDGIQGLPFNLDFVIRKG